MRSFDRWSVDEEAKRWGQGSDAGNDRISKCSGKGEESGRNTQSQTGLTSSLHHRNRCGPLLSCMQTRQPGQSALHFRPVAFFPAGSLSKHIESCFSLRQKSLRAEVSFSDPYFSCRTAVEQLCEVDYTKNLSLQQKAKPPPPKKTDRFTYRLETDSW